MTKQKTYKFRFTWLLHLLLFVIVQIIFSLTDGAKIWIIFNLNDLGEKFVATFDWLFNSFQLYDSKQLNYVTVVWIGALLLHGVETIMSKCSGKHSKAI